MNDRLSKNRIKIYWHSSSCSICWGFRTMSVLKSKRGLVANARHIAEVDRMWFTDWTKTISGHFATVSSAKMIDRPTANQIITALESVYFRSIAAIVKNFVLVIPGTSEEQSAMTAAFAIRPETQEKTEVFSLQIGLSSVVTCCCSPLFGLAAFILCQ